MAKNKRVQLTSGDLSKDIYSIPSKKNTKKSKKKNQITKNTKKNPNVRSEANNFKNQNKKGITKAQSEKLERKTQKDQVIDLFIKNRNKPMHYKEIARETGIIVHNIRRIMGENVAGRKTETFLRLEPGVYKLIDSNLPKVKENSSAVQEQTKHSKIKKINNEVEIRKDLYSKFRNLRNTVEISHSEFDRFQTQNNFKIYGGQAGIFRDNKRTRLISNTEEGLVVSILSTPLSIYEDLVDWDNGELIYMYPQTKRHSSFDKNEVQALRNNFKHNIPFFYIYSERKNKNTKEVWLGWVIDDDPKSKSFLIKFNDKYIKEEILVKDYEKDDDYEPHASSERKKVSSKTTSRPGQTKFRYRLIKRYGMKCAFCDISEEKILEAAHIIPIGGKHNGSDHPGNGLILCRNCHKLQEEGIVLIEPDTYKLKTILEGMTLIELKIKRNDLNHLQNKPNKQSLEYLYKLKLKK